MADIDSPPTDAGANNIGQASGRDDLSLVRAIAESSALQNQLYLRYRRPLMQVFHHRRIDPDVAKDLLQRTFEQGIKKIRSEEGMVDPTNLGGYLYQTACNLATAYRRGEFAHKFEREPDALANLADGALSLEDRVEREQLSQWVRELMSSLPIARDRDVLMRFYLEEEPRASICSSLRLSDLQLNQILWRARQRFGDILRRNGLDTHATSVESS